MNLYGAELPEVSQEQKIKGRIICLIGLKEEHFATWFISILKFDSGDKISVRVGKKIVSLYGTKLPEVDQERDIKMGRYMIRIVFCGC